MGNLPTSDPYAIIEFHKKLIEQMVQNEEVVTALSGESSYIGICLKEPDIRLRLIVDGRNTRLESIGPDDKSVDDPTLNMKWETAYKFWHGKLDIMSAILSNLVRVEGRNMEPLFKLKSVVHHAREASQTVVEELGWT